MGVCFGGNTPKIITWLYGMLCRLYWSLKYDLIQLMCRSFGAVDRYIMTSSGHLINFWSGYFLGYLRCSEKSYVTESIMITAYHVSTRFIISGMILIKVVHIEISPVLWSCASLRSKDCKLAMKTKHVSFVELAFIQVVLGRRVTLLTYQRRFLVVLSNGKKNEIGRPR